MTEVIEEQDGGTRRVIVTDSKVIRGKVERVTGAGNVVVYPSPHDPDVKKGEEALIMTDATQVRIADFDLELLKDHVSSPYASDFAIVVKAHSRSLERCRLYCDGTQLSAVDSAGARSELPLPVGGWLTFRIPDTLKAQRASSVELRDGDLMIMRETLGNLPGAETL